MKIQYASDLHLEFPENKEYLRKNPIQPFGDIMLLAGDIVLFRELHKHLDFFKYLSDNFEKTYWVPGNHEYYHFDISKKSGAVYEAILDNVFLVNNQAVTLENSKFLLSTLWTKINPAHQWKIEKRISDFHVIKYNDHRFSTHRYNELHEQCLAFLRQELTTTENTPTVVVTHHLPTFLNYPEKYKGDSLNEVFAVELFDLIESNGPDFWIYGHHHFNGSDFRIGKTLLTTNQLGYVADNENIEFDNSKFF
ncbi:MAG: metallophosphoesterase [Bacteroidota bacterium]|nr:metallophosphoesterase [Bacteroidota bacterium]